MAVARIGVTGLRTRVADYERQWQRYDAGLRKPGGLARPRPRSASTTSRSTSSRPARTRRSPARSRPGSPRRGASRSRPATSPTASRRTSAPTARCSRATCTRRSPGCWSPATSRPRATRPCSCSTASSSPTGRCRATRCPTASRRPTPAASSSTRCSYPILMDWQSGLAGDRKLYRQHVIPAADFRGRPRSVGRRRALGGAERLLAVDDRGRDRRAHRGRRDREGQRRPAARRRLPGDRRRLRAQHQGVDGDHERPVHQPPASRATSSGSPRRPIPNSAEIRSTSATEASPSTSAR